MISLPLDMTFVVGVASVEIMCILIDTLLVPELLERFAPLNKRSDWAPEYVINHYADEVADLFTSVNAPRINRLVFDYIPRPSGHSEHRQER